MKIYLILILAFVLGSGFAAANHCKVCNKLNDKNTAEEVKPSEELKPFSELKEITAEFGGTNAPPPPPPPEEQMDGIPVPGIPDGADLDIEVPDKPVESKEKEESVFDRDSDLDPSFAIDPIQEIKNAPMTKESERDEEAWKEREQADGITEK